MNRATAAFVKNLGPERLDVLEVSGDSWRSFGFRSYESASYPEFDISRDRRPGTYDLVIAEQVFEHLRYPARAAANVLTMLREEGVLLVTTPFLIKIHPAPVDLWRWTPDGLKAFLEDCGFSPVETGSWGNRRCVVGNFDSWPDFDPDLHSLENESEFPLVVWAFARRPSRKSILSVLTSRSADRRS